VRSGSSYCSQSELPVTFGLAENQKVDAITVVWPSGAKTELKSVISAKAINIREGVGITDSRQLYR
jgi:hypothetical protein